MNIDREKQHADFMEMQKREIENNVEIEPGDFDWGLEE